MTNIPSPALPPPASEERDSIYALAEAAGFIEPVPPQVEPAETRERPLLFMDEKGNTLTTDGAAVKALFDAMPQPTVGSKVLGLVPVAELLSLRRKVEEVEAGRDALSARINSPETEDWMAGVPLEAAHQIERWGASHDAGKEALDWFWLIGYLSQKAATSQMAGDLFKAKHHTISTAAALLNWHRHLTGENTAMRPGIDPVERGVEPARALGEQP